jgi:predicted nuclease of predicted toxin-antitoxin system
LKILLDSCVSPKAADALRGTHEVVWVGDWEKDPGDQAISDFAIREKFVLVTIDKDFGDLLHLGRFDPCGVLRLVGFRASAQGPGLAQNVGQVRT